MVQISCGNLKNLGLQKKRVVKVWINLIQKSKFRFNLVRKKDIRLDKNEKDY